MALDQNDLASLSTAIQDAITRGFSSAFPQRGSPPVPPAPPAPPGGPPAPPDPSPAPSPNLPDTRTTSVDVNRTLVDRAVSAFTATMSAGKAGIEGLIEIQKTASVQNYRDLVRNFSGEIKKITSEEFLERDFSKIINKGDKTVIESYRNLQEQADQFFEYEGLEFEK
jgi:hypothetical protein